MTINGSGRRRSRALPLSVAVALLAVLALVVAGLSYAAVTGALTGEPEGLPTKPGAPTELPVSPEDTEDEAPEPEASASDDPIDPTEPVAEPIGLAVPTRVLAAVDEDTLIRATAGTCENPGHVEFSANGGETWAVSETFAETTATQVLRILPTRAEFVQIIALDANCEPQIYRTENLGGTWFQPVSAAGAWFFDPADPVSIGAPDGAARLPCTAVTLAATEDRAAVVCDDGSVTFTEDRAASWSGEAAVEGILAVTYSDTAFTAALGADETCEGVRVVALEDDGVAAPLGCVEAPLTADALNAGDIALAQPGQSVFVWVGDRFAASTDGGATWS